MNMMLSGWALQYSEVHETDDSTSINHIIYIRYNCINSDKDNVST